MKNLIIANISIQQDSEGRFCLNDLHRASGGENKHRPKYWLESKQTIELIEVLAEGGIPPLEQNQPLRVINGGNNQGTYGCKELVYAYAMWISAKFHLAVIRAYDAMVNSPQHLIPQTLPEALRLAADLADQNKMLENQVAEIQPKADALDLLATKSEGSMSITDAAKARQIQPKVLFQWLNQNMWIYRRSGNKEWIAYQRRLQQGFLEHKITTISLPDGSERMCYQVLVTAKGLAELAQQLDLQAA